MYEKRNIHFFFTTNVIKRVNENFELKLISSVQTNFEYSEYTQNIIIRENNILYNYAHVISHQKLHQNKT